MAFAYTIAFFLVCVLALLLLLWASPRRYQVKVVRTLPAPPERVWPYVSEPERFPQWFPYVASCEHIAGPPRGVGQKRRVRIDRNGVLGEREEEAITWEENVRIDLQRGDEVMHGSLVGWRDARAEFRLARVPEGTAVTGVLWFYGRGLLGGIFSLLFFRKRHEKDFRLALQYLERRLREETFPT